MTNPTPHGQVPDALRLAEEITNLECSSEAVAKTIAAAADELCRLHVENASLRAQQPAPAPLSDADLVELGKSEKSGLHPWGIGTTRADYLRAVRAVLDAARKQGDTP